jgi:hypothetical protein
MFYPDKPEKIKIIYHENTKVQKYEKDHENIRIFAILWFCPQDSPYYRLLSAFASLWLCVQFSGLCSLISGIGSRVLRFTKI